MIERVFSAEGALMLSFAAVVLLCASDPFGENGWGWRLWKRISQGKRTTKDGG